MDKATSSAAPHEYTSLPQSQKKKKLPYTWLTFIFLVVLVGIIVFVGYTLGVKNHTSKSIKSASHNVNNPYTSGSKQPSAH